jgi:hypothetical protein
MCCLRGFESTILIRARHTAKKLGRQYKRVVTLYSHPDDLIHAFDQQNSENGFDEDGNGSSNPSSERHQA